MFPNIRNPLGAILIQEFDYSAIATARASVVLLNKCKDIEKIALDYFF